MIIAKHIVAARIAIILCLFASSRIARAADTNTNVDSIPALRAAVETVLKESKTPGAAIAIVSRDREEWVAGIGKADVAADKPVTLETLFRLGSISKSFVAVAALQLQEQGKLKLTDTVRQWAPDVAFTNPWEATDPVRLVHLMEHTSGFDDMHFREYALDDPTPMSLSEALAYGATSRVSRWRPGTRMSYCNSGPAVLAAVLEKVSGERFEDYVREHIFKPLHMDTADYFYTPAVAEHLSTLYHRDGVTPYPYWHIAFRSSAGVSASAKDMANYVRFFLQRGSLDGTQVLQAASIERMERTETMPSAKLGAMVNYGLFNYAVPEGPFVFRGHNGAVMGGVAQMEYLPNDGRGYVVMLNSGNFGALWKIGKLVRHYITRDLRPPALPPVVAVPAELRQHYGGYYQFISPDEQWSYGLERLIYIKKLTFTTAGISTSTHGLKPERWLPVSERLFRVEDESIPTLALLPDADGQVLLQIGFATFKRVSALRVWAERVGSCLVAVLVLSSIIMAPIWGIRRFLGKSRNPGPLPVRVWPLVSAVLLVSFDVLLLACFRGMITSTYIDDVSLGVLSVHTMSIMLCSLGFPLAAAMGLYVAYRERATPMRRVAYWHSVLVGIAMAATAVYFGYWGLIGLRLWA